MELEVMGRAMTKRNKPYRPREVKIPITRGLLDSFGQELHFALMTARAGHFNTDNFDRIAAAFNVIWGALFHHPSKDPAVIKVLEGAMRAMNECSARGDRTGVWTLNITELATVTAATHKAEEALQFLNVNDLYNSMQKLREVRLEERRAA